MAVRIKNPRDFYTGVIFGFFAACFLFGARHFPLGGTQDMGPAYFPTVVAGLLLLIGVVLVARSLASEGKGVERIGWRGFVLVLGGLALFGILIDQAGLIPAVAVLVFVSAAGGREFRFSEVLVLAVVLLAMVLGIFYYGLGMQFDLWRTP